MQGTVASDKSLASYATPDLLGVLRARKAQAQHECEPYLAPVLDRNSMLFWLAQAAVSAREAAGRKQVHIAASANRDQSSIYRFEQAAKGKSGWPRDADRLVAAYADDLDVAPIELWQQALQLWQKDQAQGPVEITAAEEQAASDGFQVPKLPQQLRDALNPPREGQQPNEDTPRKRGSSGQGA